MKIRRAVMLASIVGGAGCYNASFVRNDGPVAAQGVMVSLTGQRCDFSPDFNADEQAGGYPNRLDLGIRVSVRNDTRDTLTVRPESLRLVAGSGADAPVKAPAPVSVGPGATAQISVRFLHQGELGCNASLALGLANAILAGDRALDLRPLSFVAAASES